MEIEFMTRVVKSGCQNLDSHLCHYCVSLSNLFNASIPYFNRKPKSEPIEF